MGGQRGPERLTGARHAEASLEAGPASLDGLTGSETQKHLSVTHAWPWFQSTLLDQAKKKKSVGELRMVSALVFTKSSSVTQGKHHVRR